jgi:FkbM family methyltransferase
MKLLRSLGRALRSNRHRPPDAFATQRRLVQAAAPLIVDVGAHLGETAKRYRSLFPAATIHCFEPFPPSFAALRGATAADGRIRTHALALGDSIGSASLHSNRSSATNSLLASDTRGSDYWGGEVLSTKATLEIAVTTLDRFCAEASLDHIDILKLDVQGAEYAALSGAHDLLSRQAIDVVYMEMITAPTYVGQRELHDYLALFRSCGYVLFDFYNPVRKNGRLLQTDNLMVAEPFLAAYEARTL